MLLLLHMIDTNHFKEKLLAELKTLEEELSTIAEKNPQHEGDFEAKHGESIPDTADDSELADAIDDYEINAAILRQLEVRYQEVKAALARIDSDLYGTCEVGSETIEIERLEANPAARTCIAHKEHHVQ